MTITLPCPLGCVHPHMHRLMHWRNPNGVYGCNQSGSGWSDQDQATEDASLVTCPPCLTEVEAMRAERGRKIADAKARKAFLPPADSAINVHDIEAMGSHGFAYQAGAARFTLIAASADGGQVTATWSRGGASGFARALTARLAIRQALATFDDLALSVDVERALLSRKTEYVWRGPITPERVAVDWDTALSGEETNRELAIFRTEAARHLSGVELDAAVLRYARDLEGRPRCAGCLYVDEHPVDCPFHPAVLEEARANVLARTSQDITAEGLDLYADYLRTKENSNA